MRLILMRHCKSDWSAAGLRDHDRPLNSRGQRSAAALGDWLRANGYLPELALISSSKRTMETFDGLGLDCESRYVGALYHASAEAMMEVLRTNPAPNVLMIGHNPGIGEFAERLVGSPPDHERFWDYPTGATLIAEFDDAPGWKSANARDFVIPRALLSEQ